MSLERRKKLIELASKYGVPLIEDDPYGKLLFEGEPITPIAALDASYRGCENGKFEG
jgi:2-aminoadipate transaminase